MLDYNPNTVLSNEEFDTVGSSPIRHDGADKVTGRAKYGADTILPGMLHGKILRSPHAHAIIKSVKENTGFQKILLDKTHMKIFKSNPNLYIDLSSIAKGFAVDKIALYLESATQVSLH